MCGIAGIVQADAGVLSPLITAMTRSLAHRGPDDEGFLVDGSRWWTTAELPPGERRGCVPPDDPARVAFGHRRLSIIDTSPAGHEPISDTTGRYWLTYNGEIYNYVELRAELTALGASFRTATDAEVLIEAWKQWGVASLERLVGMWAFALYDREAKTVTLSRDPLGIKPLYLARRAGRLGFASEPAALLHLPWVERRPDPQRLFDFLRYGRSDDGTATFFADVERFPAGHVATVRLDRPDVVPAVAYWTDGPEVDPSIDMASAAKQLRELLLTSIEIHMRSDVAFGAALSGGLDSSTLVCLMRELRGSSLDLHTFSFVADDPALTEERWIDAVVQKVKPTRHSVTPTADELAADVDHLIQAQGEPLLGLSSYAEFRVHRLAAEHGIKVVLDGQGADEMFGGYSPYLGQRLATLVRSGRLPSAYRFWRTADASPHAKALGRSVAVHAARNSLPAWVEPVGRRLMGDAPFPAWLKAEWFERHAVTSLAHRNPAGRWMLQAALADDRQHMFQWQLRSEDRDAMWHGVESRVPFVTTPLIRFARTLPEHLLIDDQATPKAVLRHAMRGIVPDEVLDRKEKIGFAPPESRWLRAIGPWIDESLNLLERRAAPLVDIESLRSRWSASVGERRIDGALWRAVNVGRWLELHDLSLDGASAAPKVPAA